MVNKDREIEDREIEVLNEEIDFLNEELLDKENLEEVFLNKLKKTNDITLESLNNKLDKLIEKIDILTNKLN